MDTDNSVVVVGSGVGGGGRKYKGINIIKNMVKVKLKKKMFIVYKYLNNEI